MKIISIILAFTVFSALGLAQQKTNVQKDAAGNVAGDLNFTGTTTATTINATSFSPTNITGATAHGQLFIGNVTNGNFTKSTVTAGTGITVTNGAASITIAATGASAPTVNAQTGTAYTLVSGDANNIVTMANAAANVLTIPTNATVAFATGTVISVSQQGAGVTTITPISGTTMNGGTASVAIASQYNWVTLVKLGTNAWSLSYADTVAVGAITGLGTGVATALAINVGGVGSVLTTNGTGQKDTWIVAVSDETTAITTGTAKVTFRAPYAATITAVRASLNTVSSSGTPTFNIKETGSTILSTLLTIDASELTSTTAVNAAVISDTAIADDAEITIDIDVAGTGAKGAKVAIYVTRN